MAQDLTISPQDIAAALRKYVEGFEPALEREQVGRVTATGDGVALVEGLPGAMANELLEFPNGILGIALNLDESSIGCVVLGEAAAIEEGGRVKQTGRILSILFFNDPPTTEIYTLSLHDALPTGPSARAS